jgi:hypothetical protein
MEPTPAVDWISDLYIRALESTPGQHCTFLVEECNGDAALRGEVESLLRHESDSARFLDTPVAVALGELPGATDRSQMIGRQLDPYSIAAPLRRVAGGVDERRTRVTVPGRRVNPWPDLVPCVS